MIPSLILNIWKCEKHYGSTRFCNGQAVILKYISEYRISLQSVQKEQDYYHKSQEARNGSWSRQAVLSRSPATTWNIECGVWKTGCRSRQEIFQSQFLILEIFRNQKSHFILRICLSIALHSEIFFVNSDFAKSRQFRILEIFRNRKSHFNPRNCLSILTLQICINS